MKGSEFRSMQVKFKQGLSSALPEIEEGSLIFTTDDGKLYLDTNGQRITIGGGQEMVGEKLVDSGSLDLDNNAKCTKTVAACDYVLIHTQMGYDQSGAMAISGLDIKLIAGKSMMIPIVFPYGSTVGFDMGYRQATLNAAGTSFSISKGVNAECYLDIECYKYV